VRIGQWISYQQFRRNLFLIRGKGYNTKDMSTLFSQQPQKRSGLPQLLIYCLLVSFIIHLIIIWLLPKFSSQPEPVTARPTFVTLEDLPSEPRQTPKEMELDERPRPDQPPPLEATRLAEDNQQVEKEMAPQGEDSRDQPITQIATENKLEKKVSDKKDPIKGRETENINSEIEKEKKLDVGLSQPEPRLSEPQLQPNTELTIEELTKPTPDTLTRIARNDQRERIKKREHVLEGDAVYLNLQHDYLISFFQRFSNRIESNWNYPVKAAQRNEFGVLLLKIIVTREGKLVDVELLETSGYDALDYEAIQAVYRAAPFGPITKHWQHDQMKIYAHFQYTLSDRYIFGQ